MADKFVLLVEGKDDVHVISHLLKHHRLPDNFSIKDKNGIENLLGTLDVELLASGLERLGIVVDADINLVGRWKSLEHVLVQSGYEDVPAEPSADGTIIFQTGLPTVGIWIMPDNKASGMLEDFVAFLVPPGDVLWEAAENVVQQVMQQDCRFPAAHRSKAEIHTWLAWQKNPGSPLGSSITERYLDADAPHAKNLWLGCRTYSHSVDAHILNKDLLPPPCV